MAFDLSTVLSGITPEPASGREQIQYIQLDHIDGDPKNFYQLSGIEDLAANISLCGLQQPIRVRENPGADGRYIIVSGHRRHRALQELAKDAPEKWAEAPCIVERDEISPALRQLRLIFANANTRTMTSSEVAEQVRQVEELFYQLKEEGYEFSGRMRSHVSEVVGIKEARLAKLKAIQNNLIPEVRAAWERGDLRESYAYEVSTFPPEQQQILNKVMGENWATFSSYLGNVKGSFGSINAQTCKDGGPCLNCENKMRRAAKEKWFNPCNHCCKHCDSLRSCKYACSKAADEKKAAQAAEKDRRQADKAKNALLEEKQERQADLVREIYRRIGELRREAGASVEDLLKSGGRSYFGKRCDDEEEKYEAGEVSCRTNLPISYGFDAGFVEGLRNVADLLGCSIDYLLGRCSNRTPAAAESAPEPPAQAAAGMWHTDSPKEDGHYLILTIFAGDFYADDADWCGDYWCQCGVPLTAADGPVVAWTSFPDIPGLEGANELDSRGPEEEAAKEALLAEEV